MIRLAHISDTHFCDHHRPEDLANVLEAFLIDAAASHVDLIVHAGDFFDHRSTPPDRIMLASFLLRATEIAPVFGVKGNHDQPQDLELFNMIETDGVLRIAERPTRPGEAVRMGRFGLIALPWFDKSHLVAGLSASVDAETTRKATIDVAHDLLIGFKAEAERVREQKLIPIFVSHAMVEGSTVSTGQVMQGVTVELSPYAIKEIGAEYAALGHVHKAQEWFGGRVAYSGSPIRHNFGEPEEKGWRLVTFDEDGQFVSNEFKTLPARRIVLLDADFTAGAADVSWDSMGQGPHQLEGALVRLRYKVRPQDLASIDEVALRRLLAEMGAADVKLEAEVQHTTRVRSEVLAGATTTADKVDAYLEAKGETLDPDTKERLRGKIDDIEAEVSGG